MSNDAGWLDSRVWVKARGRLILVGERYRLEEGKLTMVWHVDPTSISGVMWIEDTKGQKDVASAF
jgi:hypothetical protein